MVGEEDEDQEDIEEEETLELIKGEDQEVTKVVVQVDAHHEEVDTEEVELGDQNDHRGEEENQEEETLTVGRNNQTKRKPPMPMT